MKIIKDGKEYISLGEASEAIAQKRMTTPRTIKLYISNYWAALARNRESMKKYTVIPVSEILSTNSDSLFIPVEDYQNILNQDFESIRTKKHKRKMEAENA